MNETPCVFFAKGSCKQGAMCQFSHDPNCEPAQLPLCRNFGSPMGCRFGDNCAFLHNERCPTGDPTYGPGQGQGRKRFGGPGGGYGGRGGRMNPMGGPGPYGPGPGGPYGMQGGYGPTHGQPGGGPGMGGPSGGPSQAQAAVGAQPNQKPPVPPGWTAQFDNNTQMWYYINNATLATQWEVPTEPVYVNQVPDSNAQPAAGNAAPAAAAH